jgi:hypothetical protein
MTNGATIPARDRLIVALDVDSVETARALVARLGDSVSFYKIGMELAYGGGLPLVEELKAGGKKVFVDLKLHDIRPYGGARDAADRPARRGFPHHSRLSADDARRPSGRGR